MSVAKYISPGGTINNTHRNTEVHWGLRFTDPEKETVSHFFSFENNKSNDSMHRVLYSRHNLKQFVLLTCLIIPAIVYCHFLSFYTFWGVK